MVDDLLVVLRPVQEYFLWDILAYVIFILALIGLIIAGDSSTTITGMFAFILMGAVIDKTYAVGWFLEPNTSTLQMRIDTHLSTFWIMIMRGLMFAGAMLGVIEGKKKVRAIFFLLMLILLFYTLGRWWTQDGANFFSARGMGSYLPIIWK